MARWLAVAASVAATGLGSAQACQYCRSGGDPQACRDLIKTDRSGALRLDAVIDQFQVAPAPAAPLAIVTSAVDLPAPVARKVVAPAIPGLAGRPVATSISQSQARALDVALIGLAVAGGVFCWRTRRPQAAGQR